MCKTCIMKYIPEKVVRKDVSTKGSILTQRAAKFDPIYPSLSLKIGNFTLQIKWGSQYQTFELYWTLDNPIFEW